MKKGLWESPLSAKKVAAAGISFEDLCADGPYLFWTESRPLEKGRVAAVMRQAKDQEEIPLSACSVKSRVHEYGGAAIAALNGIFYFVNDTEKSLCRMDIKTKRVETLFQSSTVRCAEITLHPQGRFVYFVGEDHTDPLKVKNALYLFDFERKSCQVVAEGHDFYASPKISFQGEEMAFITWDFPHMPWDESVLWKASIQQDGSLATPSKVSFGKDVSVQHPLWSQAGALYYVSDKTGFWNLYRNIHGKEDLLIEKSADFALPLWKLGRTSFTEVVYKNRPAFVCSYTEQGIDHLGVVYPDEKRMETIDVPFTSMSHLCAGKEGLVYFFGASAYHARSLICFNLHTKSYEILKESFSIGLDETYLSSPELIAFPSCLPGKEAYAFYYPPKNPKYAEAKEKPPLIVRAHGGPTGHSVVALSLEIQFWTTRGFAYLDVNYGGSTGFGREYRDRLKKNWGVVDVKDCRLAAEATVKRGLADPQKLLIKGGSSGGLTALMALCVSPLFAGATSYYGVADLEMLATDTHKFELHYLDLLIGPYPKCKSTYIERSPVHNIDKISSPVLLLQGKEDKVVPPSQSEKIYLKLKEKNLPTQLILFDEEGHGFRRADTIERSLEAEWEFYKKVLELV